MLPLVTQRLVVREFNAGDLDELADVYADPAVVWWQEAPNTREQTAEVLAHILERYRVDGMAEYAVGLRATGHVLGYCGPELRDIEGDLLPELGWALRSDVWGRGYATEAAAAVVGHLRELGLPVVYSAILPGNVRSEGVARKLGMTVERVVDWHGAAHDLWALDLS